MKKKIAILGSTGSVGNILCDYLYKDLKNYQVVLLVAKKNYKKIIKQAIKLKVNNLIITDTAAFKKVLLNKEYKFNVYNNYNAFKKIFKYKIHYTLSAISGLDGLEPTYKMIKYSKNIAISNKESILCAWNLISVELRKYKTKFIPVDSEHFTIWYSLNNKIRAKAKKIFLTASGGPFLNLKNKHKSNFTVSKALKHPNWKMGNKITIDSATMMNKVFEVIEAKNIFNLEYKDLSILTHPKSYIHSIIFFENGLIDIIGHDTDMKIPIINSLKFGENCSIKTNGLNLKLLNNLNLNYINQKQFPVIKIIKMIPNHSSLFETVIVSVNDALVELFLNKKIKFTEISEKLLKIINLKELTAFKRVRPKKIEEIKELSHYVNLKTKEIMYKAL